MRAVDTNVLVRLLVEADEHRERKKAAALLEHDVYVSHLVLAECIWVLATVYEYSAASLMEVIARFLQHDRVVFEDPLVVRLALEQYRKRPSIGFMDCMVLELARKAGHLPLATFDRDLAKLEGVERL